MAYNGERLSEVALMSGKIRLLVTESILLAGMGITLLLAGIDPVPEPAIPFSPKVYRCLPTSGVVVDGDPGDPAWKQAVWSDPFIDIGGGDRSVPPLSTRVKMAWDQEFFYILAELSEPDVWATLTERDAVVFTDNDFEVFIDPDGDTHHYFELEINALGTLWDLFLEKPYRDGGRAMNHWQISGLKSATRVNGTLNHPGDRDMGWTVEWGIPWRVLREFAPEGRSPREGEVWRVNFSRVEWATEVREGRYVKKTDPATGKPLAENNWVWSPQGLINMHYPEMWGYVVFVGGTGKAAALPQPEVESAKWLLRRIYYRQRCFRLEHGRYAGTLAELGLADLEIPTSVGRPRLQTTDSLFEASLNCAGETWRIRPDGLVWKDE